MPDAYLNTGTTNFDKALVAAILKATQATLRGGLAFTPRGSIIEAKFVPGVGMSGVFRSFAFSDLPEDGWVTLADTDPDPDVEDLAMDYIEFTAVKFGRTVGVTDNAREHSPHNPFAIAVEKVSRDIATSGVDNVARALYAAATPELFGGTGNTDVAGVAAGDKMTAGLLKDGVAILRSRDVKPLANGLYAFVADPFVIRDLQEDDDYPKEVSYANPAAFLTGQIATYAGAAIIDAGSRGIVAAGAGTGSIDVHKPALIGGDAAFAGLGQVEVIPVTGPDKSDPLNRRDLVSYKGRKGAVLNDLQAARFLTIAVATTL